MALSTFLISILFLLFFGQSKHNPGLAAVNPFAEDPFDAVGSFGVQLSLLAALISMSRVLRPQPESGIPASRAAMAVRAGAVSLLAVSVTLATDIAAMVRYPSLWTHSSPGLFLAVLVGGMMLLTAPAVWSLLILAKRLGLPQAQGSWAKPAAVCLAALIILSLYPVSWRRGVAGAIVTAIVGMVLQFVTVTVLARLISPRVDTEYNDVFDDLSAIREWVADRSGAARVLFRPFEKLAAVPGARRILDWLNPRRHPWRLIVSIAIGMGIILALAEAIGEGLSPHAKTAVLAVTVTVGIEAAGVALGYFLLGRFLGLIRRQ